MKYCQENAKAIEAAYQTNRGIFDLDRTPFLLEYAQLSKKALKDYHCIEDISYGNQPEQVFDFLSRQKNLATKSPLWISIHGGYWQSQTHKDGSSMAAVFLQKNCHFASIHYRLCPKVNIKELINDCVNALKFILAKADDYGYCKDQIYLIGHSAGAHIAAFMLIQFELKGALLISGVFDLTPIQFTRINDVIQLTQGQIEQYSCQNHKVLGTPKIMLALGGLESKEFYKQSKMMHQIYQKQKITSQFKVYANLHHFNILTALNNSHSAIYQDLRDYFLV